MLKIEFFKHFSMIYIYIYIYSHAIKNYKSNPKNKKGLSI